jgi:hypothetical protein
MEMDLERRRSPRTRARVYFNKYIDGRPHLCEALELSATGMLARRVHEPDDERAAYAVEISEPDAPASERVWVCASPVWRSGEIEALVFVESSRRDRALLEALVARIAT